MSLPRILAYALLTLGCVTSESSLADSVVAVVEDVIGNPAKVRVMDYVVDGQVIILGPSDVLVVSYIASCMQETITGGLVTIGLNQSDVERGRVDRIRVDCDAGKMMQSTSREFDSAAGSIMRRISPQSNETNFPAQFTLYGRSPIVQVNGPGLLVIERLDQSDKANDVTLSIRQDELLQDAFFDCDTRQISLVAGGVYRATWGARQTVFRIDSAAKPGRAPVIGRLVRLNQ